MKIVLVGPTGVGKTTVSIELAKALDAEIISGDAYQFYRHLDVASAKIKPSEKQGIIHHLIDILPPNATFSVYDYQQIVRQTIDSIESRRKSSILVGGSGLYVQSVICQYEFRGPNRNESETRSWENLSNQDLYDQIAMKQPELAKSIHVNNRRRLLRAIQLIHDPNYTFELKSKVLHYEDVFLIGLKLPKPILHQRIEERVDLMVLDGLENEARYFYQNAKNTQAAMAIGIKEFFPYFAGDIDLDTAIEQVKVNSKKYAKRQMTWFNNQLHTTWFDVNLDDVSQTVQEIISFIQTKS